MTAISPKFSQTGAPVLTVDDAGGEGLPVIFQHGLCGDARQTIEAVGTAIIGAPEIADILPMSDRSLYVQGKRIGTTNISIFDSSMQVIGVVDIEVTPDTGNLREKIDASTNGGSIRVSSNNGQVVLSGEARDAGRPPAHRWGCALR